jgi:hypothetical protein
MRSNAAEPETADTVETRRTKKLVGRNSVEPGDKAENVDNCYAKTLDEQRISKHPVVIRKADEFVSAEPIHAEKSETQREHHWNGYEDEQPHAVGKNKQPGRERLFA